MEVMVQGGSSAMPAIPALLLYPVLSNPEGYLIASVTSVIWSAPARSGGREAVLAREVQTEREAERTLCSLRLAGVSYF